MFAFVGFQAYLSEPFLLRSSSLVIVGGASEYGVMLKVLWGIQAQLRRSATMIFPWSVSPEIQLASRWRLRTVAATTPRRPSTNILLNLTNQC